MEKINSNYNRIFPTNCWHHHHAGFDFSFNVRIRLSDASYAPHGSAIAAALVTSRVVTGISYQADT